MRLQKNSEEPLAEIRTQGSYVNMHITAIIGTVTEEDLLTEEIKEAVEAVLAKNSRRWQVQYSHTFGSWEN